MGSKQSSLANQSTSNNTGEMNKLELKFSGERGLKEIENNVVIEESVEVEYETDSENDSSDSEDDMENEDFSERLRILEDAKNLKTLAVAFLHPELPVKVDPTATARCYFDRPSAPEQESGEEAEYRAQVLADAAALKQLAVDYAHPEIGVVTSDPTATARCYFDRPSAHHTQTNNEIESVQSNRAQSMKEIPATKQKASNQTSKSIKTIDSSKSSDIVRSLSSVQLFGLDGEGDASY